ncbi:MAG: hypothetical protein M3P49_14045 [Actinomycetota bacterium]|nr:hypothetical protein [Actinomycetota bacterium]
MDEIDRQPGYRAGDEPEGSGPDPTPSARDAAEAWDTLGPFPDAATPAAAAQAHQSGRIVFRTPGAAQEVRKKAQAHEDMHAEASRAVSLALALSHLPPGRGARRSRRKGTSRNGR